MAANWWSRAGREPQVEFTAFAADAVDEHDATATVRQKNVLCILRKKVHLSTVSKKAKNRFVWVSVDTVVATLLLVFDVPKKTLSPRCERHNTLSV